MGKLKELFGDQLFSLTPMESWQLVRRKDPETSREAAEKVVPKLRLLQQRVLAVLRQYPDGLTDYQIEMLLGDHGSTYRTRRSELVALGLVRDSGHKKVINGTHRTVWIAI